LFAAKAGVTVASVRRDALSEVDHMPEKLHRLEQLRRTRDWSYRDLADNIFVTTRFRRNQDCWRKICQGETETPHGPTEEAMRLFFAALAVNGSRRRRAS
jgi:hypothetical protein